MLADAGCTVTAVESFVTAVEDARHNLDGLAVDVRAGSVEDVVGEVAEGADLVVLDPPRTGAGVAVMEALAAARPRRDRLRLLRPGHAGPRPQGRSSGRLRPPLAAAFDLFPMTAHVECLAVLEPLPEP